MARGGARKADGPSKKGSKAAVTLLMAPEEGRPIPDMPDPAHYLGLPVSGRGGKDEELAALGIGYDPAEIEWAEPVKQWWYSVWTSPMVSEYVEADLTLLYLGCYYLHESLNPFYKVGDKAKYTKLFQDVCRSFGLSPLAREQLRWNIAQGTAAMTRTNQLRAMASQGQNKAITNDDISDLYEQYGQE